MDGLLQGFVWLAEACLAREIEVLRCDTQFVGIDVIERRYEGNCRVEQSKPALFDDQAQGFAERSTGWALKTQEHCETGPKAVDFWKF